MNLQVLGVHPFDRAVPMNRGVIADELVGTSVGVTLRRVTYQDPESGTVYIYLEPVPKRGFFGIALGLCSNEHPSNFNPAGLGAVE